MANMPLENQLKYNQEVIPMFNPYASPYMQQPFPQQYTPTPTPTPQVAQPNTPTVLYASTARDFAFDEQNEMLKKFWRR